MSDEIKKEWYKSKSMLGAIIVIAMGLIHYYKTGDITESMTTIGIGFSLIGLRMAKQPI